MFGQEIKWMTSQTTNPGDNNNYYVLSFRLHQNHLVTEVKGSLGIQFPSTGNIKKLMSVEFEHSSYKIFHSGTFQSITFRADNNNSHFVLQL